MPKLNKVSISNGLFIDGRRVDGLTDINIESSVDNVSAITMKFYGIIDGLDNIQETYQFKEPEKTYKPNRKYKSR
ncbi:TPA: hypothetical protein ACGU3G_000885 [Enterococcus faecium]|uniref:hypothetical protein n=1 Tax=Enterococcus faecium TaxID=1352 RepID=UPI002DBE4523|nr:hypothetical protein [Enterococcus faecium]MEB6013736.1 hypothetical protein [Enterococcus faecium]HBL1458324.1 hypothetical protein [Enterococcus faecium]HBL1481834.1 hypothetical protein [Enterococcus faecium]